MNYSIIALLLLVCLSAKHIMAQQEYEPVCPTDSIIVTIADTSSISEGGQPFPFQRQRKAQEVITSTSPPIVQVVRQGGDWVEFMVHNSTTFAEVPDQIFVSFDTNLFRSKRCLMYTDLGPADLPTSLTEAQKATCFDTPHGGKMALVRVYARSMIHNGTPRTHTRNIPKCCQDPHALTAAMYNTVEYIYEVPCAATCDEPENYFDNGDNNNDIDTDTTSPTTAPVPVTDPPTMVTGNPTFTAPPTGITGPPTFLNSPGMTGRITEDPAATVAADPTEAPTEYDSEPPTPGPTAAPTTKSPTSGPTASPTLGVVVAPPPMCSLEGAVVAPQSRDLVMGSQLNGPHMGSRHGWAWPQIRDRSCGRYSNVDSEGAGAYAWPCYTATQALNRVLNFDSSYMNFRFEFDRGMKATISLADTAAASAQQESAVSFYPSGASASSACSAPPDASWDYYPLRLVKSGRYHHHWYAEKVNCNGGADDTRLEIKVTPDCVEVHIVSNKGAQTMNWLDGDSDSQTPLVSSSNGYSGISYCVQCDSEVNGAKSNGNANANDALSGCSIVEAPIPTDCCPLNPASIDDGTVRAGTSYKDPMCGSGWDYDTCTASSLVTTSMTEDVTLSTVPNYPIKADGHSFQVEVPRGSGDQMMNDDLVAVVQNNSNSWKKVKVNFHIMRPRRMTGISGVLLDPETHKPTGIHVQMSKNWHINRPMMYDGYWWTGIAHFRVPPGESKLKLVVAYQYYEGLHGVSHSQLSLMGWATNGLWEEVGLGSNGESITYEPQGHHRRQMILDTRPWLVCQMNVGGCAGNPDSTQWTENVGGGDFLNAVDKHGMYQYLVRDMVYHTMNGPRLTNATYAGTTVDQKIAVSRTVSTWTADDFVRHLHSFEYKFLEDTAGDHYQRFAMYTLGGDNYNYVRFPLFAYGIGETNALMEAHGDETIPVSEIINEVADFTYTDYYSIDAPVGCSNHDGSSSCWFSMLTDPSVNIHQRGNRGIIVRNFRGRLNGEAWPPIDQEVSPFTFNLIKSRQNGAAKDTLSIELGLPSEFKAAVDAGLKEFKEGDFLKADIELLVPPRQSADYFGNSNRLKAWMTDAGVDANFGEGWRLIAKEATEGDKIATTVFQGDLERIYHPRVKVDCGNNEARFNIEIPVGLPGILPITIAGVSETMAPLDAPLQQLWRYDTSAAGGSWNPFANGAAYQLEKDVLDNSYTFVYSLSLEFANQSSGTAVTGNGSSNSACEQFFFGVTPPSDTNPSCDDRS